MNGSRQIVRADVLAHPNSSISEIVARTGISRSTVRASLYGPDISESLFWPRLYSVIEPIANGIALEAQEIPVAEAGARWQEKRALIGDGLSGLDLTKMPYGDALKMFEGSASALLGMVNALRSVGDVPEWREEVGL